MSKYFLERLNEILNRTKNYLISRPHANAESSDYEQVLKDLDAIQNNIYFEKEHPTYKRINLYISVFPTIVAILLTCWVFLVNFKTAVKIKKIQEISMAKDSTIDLSVQLIDLQNRRLKIYSDTLIYRLAEPYPKSNTAFYRRAGVAEALIDDYISNIKTSKLYAVRIDSLKLRIARLKSIEYKNRIR